MIEEKRMEWKKREASWEQGKKENQAEENRIISEENRNKIWSSSTHTKKTDSPDNMGVASRAKTIVNYQERQNIMVKDHKKLCNSPNR